MIKKILSVILSVTLVMGTVVFSAQAAEEKPTVLAVASDLHYNIPAEELTETDPNLLTDPVFFYANRRAALENESGFIIDEFLKQCAENDDVKYVLIPGDMADHGKTIIDEHKIVAEKFRNFEKETGKSVFVINGNHDASTNDGDTQFSDFINIYKEFGYDEALSTLDGTCSYTANLGEKYRLIALDSCSESESTEDGMNLKKMSWVKNEAEKAYDDGRYPIVMMHHNILDHMPLQRIFSHDFIVRFHFSTAELFADWGIKVVLSGHEHCSDATSYTSALGNTITDFANTSLTMYPLQYKLFSFTDDEIKYETKTVDTIDFDALTSTIDGYTDAQLDLMKKGMNEYAKQFLKVGVEYRLALSLTMEKIGISEGELFYNLVNEAVSGLTDALKMPLYGENGLQEKAKEFNVEIPDSKYKNGWDLATDLVAEHYAGSENYPLDSTEVTLLLKTVDYILLSDLSNVNDKVFLSAANKVLSSLGITDKVCTDLTQFGTDILGPVTAGEYFLLAVASPILYVFANDDEVDDNNGTLEGYGAVTSESRFDSSLNNISSIFQKITKYLGFFIQYILRIFRISL